jgi:hypothetical protein
MVCLKVRRVSLFAFALLITLSGYLLIGYSPFLHCSKRGVE